MNPTKPIKIEAVVRALNACIRIMSIAKVNASVRVFAELPGQRDTIFKLKLG
jgi:hypothetical protein